MNRAFIILLILKLFLVCNGSANELLLKLHYVKKPQNISPGRLLILKKHDSKNIQRVLRHFKSTEPFNKFKWTFVGFDMQSQILDCSITSDVIQCNKNMLKALQSKYSTDWVIVFTQEQGGPSSSFPFLNSENRYIIANKDISPALFIREFLHTMGFIYLFDYPLKNEILDICQGNKDKVPLIGPNYYFGKNHYRKKIEKYDISHVPWEKGILEPELRKFLNFKHDGRPGDMFLNWEKVGVFADYRCGANSTNLIYSPFIKPRIMGKNPEKPKVPAIHKTWITKKLKGMKMKFIVD